MSVDINMLMAFVGHAGKLNGGNNVLNPYVNGNVNASNVAQQLVQGATVARQLARCFSLPRVVYILNVLLRSLDACRTFIH
jgi:hypothetical protein